MEQRHKTVISGVINKKIYYFRPHDNYSYLRGESEDKVIETYKYVREEKLWEGYLSKPPLEVGDDIYITEIDEKVTITKKIRTTDDVFIYSTSYEIDRIEDEETEKSLIEANKYMEMCKYREKKRAEEVKVPWYKKIFK